MKLQSSLELARGARVSHALLDSRASLGFLPFQARIVCFGFSSWFFCFSWVQQCLSEFSSGLVSGCLFVVVRFTTGCLLLWLKLLLLLFVVHLMACLLGRPFAVLCICLGSLSPYRPPSCAHCLSDLPPSWAQPYQNKESTLPKQGPRATTDCTENHTSTTFPS